MNVDDVVSRIANCTEELHLMLLGLRLSDSTHAGSKTLSRKVTNGLNISRVLECSGHLPPANEGKFQLCYDEILNAINVKATSIPAPTKPDIGKEVIEFLPTALLVLGFVVIVICVIVKKRRRLINATARAMNSMVWYVSVLGI